MRYGDISLGLKIMVRSKDSNIERTSRAVDEIKYLELEVKFSRNRADDLSCPTKHRLLSKRTASRALCLRGTLNIAISTMNAFTATFSRRDTDSANLRNNHRVRSRF